MNNKEIISILTDIESSIDVNSLTYRGVCVWPFIRNQTASYLAGKDRQCSAQVTEEASSRFYNIIKKMRKYLGLIIKNPGRQKITSSDVLFLARTSERVNLVKEKWYNRHSDSFSDLFGGQYSIQHLEFSDDENVRSPQFRDSFHFDLHLLVNRIKFELIKYFLPGRIHNFHLLNDYLAKIGIAPSFSEKSLRLRISLIFFRKKIFSRIIRKCKPKLFFLVCYYYDIALAAILACHECGVPVVEFQHGAQNDYNLYLTHWTQITKQGYQLLPDFFWNWGDASASRINKWAHFTDTHKSFVGGNLWISKWINEDFQTDECKKYNVQNIFPKGPKHILISLQLWPDSFPEYLFDIIRNSSPDWFWHIRQHPRHRVPCEDLEKYFLSLPNVNIEEKFSREMPLYLLLKHVDLHLTGYSTVAFEAAQFGVPTVFYHENALNGFQGLFDSSQFFYANNYEEIFLMVSIISKDTINNEKSYINVNPCQHLACLAKMIKIASEKS